MKSSLLSWIFSVLTLHSVSCSATTLTFAELPNEMQLAIVQRFVVSQKFDFCGYVDWLAVNRWAYPHTDVGMAMLVEVAKEEASLGLHTCRQHARKQQILKSVRTFVRIRSGLPIVCKTTDKEELEHLAQVLESTYQEFSSFSESPIWKKACMAGLFGHNALITLLPHLSEDFFSQNKDLLLQTAFFIGDIDSVKVIVDFVKLSDKDVLAKVPERDTVFSGSVPFIEELFKILPKLMEKRLELIEEAIRLNRLAILIRILKVVKPAEPHELNRILDSFSRLKRFKDVPYLLGYRNGELGDILIVAAGHGHLPIIRFLWPMMKAIPTKATTAVKKMMNTASRKNQRSVLEFLLWQSGEDYMKMAHKYINAAFKAAVKRGNVEIIASLTGKNNDGTFVSPGLCLPPLDELDFRYIIKITQNWKGIEYLVDLKKKGDSRFADFELVDHDNTILCMACEMGNYDLVECLLCTTDDGEFVVPRTNPATKNNKPLVKACRGGNLQIVQKLLERDISGNYIYKGIDPSAQDYQSVVNACRYGRQRILEFLLELKCETYVLPKMNVIDITRALTAAIKRLQMESLKWLLRTNDIGEYVLPGMNGVDFTRVLLDVIYWNRMEMARFILEMKDESYFLPGINGVDFTRISSSAIRWNRMEMVRFLLKMELIIPEFKHTLQLYYRVFCARSHLVSMTSKWQRLEPNRRGPG